MEIATFPENNIVIGDGQEQYRPLPAHRIFGDPYGTVTCCWQLSLWERLRLLFTGRVWHQILTFNNPLQPQLLLTEKPDLLQAEGS